MLKTLPVGIDDFKELISKNCYFVDKSLFIKELLESGAKATLITRPRRFGKTLNLSMLNCFFEKTADSYDYLFYGSSEHGNAPLAISQHKEFMAHQGQYPVIFFTLKFIDGNTWQDCFDKLKLIISKIYRHHKYLLESPALDITQKKDFNDIITRQGNRIIYEVSLQNLTEYLNEHHKKKPIILIDEYDVPIHAGFKHNYYEEVTSFIRSFLGDALKNNLHLEFAVMTGALRVAKESIFTGLNNLEVCSLLSDLYDDKFGLLTHEVDDIVTYYGLGCGVDAVRIWYNGYTSGSYTVYNPWSIINLAKQKGKLQPYWVNTSSNDIIKKLIQQGGEGVKKNIELLITGSAITKEIRESIVYADIEKNETVLWNFLLFSGYLTFKNKRLIDKHTYADFLIPNDEVACFYESTISSWFAGQDDDESYHQMLNALMSGDITTFDKLFTHFVITSFSSFDISGKRPEKFYHAFVLGMLVSLAKRFAVRSNRESGYGRYDVMLIPHDKTKLGIVIEFKKVDTYEHEDLEKAAVNALVQIKEKRYAQEMHAMGIESVVAIGIAFEGKKVLLKSDRYLVQQL
jgi:hypothetical protein